MRLSWYFPALLLLCATVTAAVAADKLPTFRFYDFMLRPGTTAKTGGPEWWTSLGDYKGSNTPVYYGACFETRHEYDIHGRVTSSSYTKQIVFFPPHSSHGSYVMVSADSRGRPLNPVDDFDIDAARIDINKWVEISGVWQGGPWEYGEFQAYSEYLLRKGLKLIRPADFAAAVNGPSRPCPDLDDYSFSVNLSEIYDKMGWNTPTPLPGR